MPWFGAAVATALGTITGALNAIGVPAALSGYLAVGGLKIGASLLISTATNALFGKKAPKQQDIAIQLAQQTNAPAWRFVYGESRATGTPAGDPVRGSKMWGCWILNSRPSYLPDFTLFLDKREVTLTGDAFDFSEGGGATSTDKYFDEGILKVWIGRGDQTAPPFDFTDQAAWAEDTDEDLWKATDAWRNRTVIFMRLDAGSSGSRAERWPNGRPLVEVEGKWSLVWDPRDEAQDPDDPATWQWSENHRLCLLDAAMRSPVKPYRVDAVELELFKAAADAADEIVTLKSGGSEKRYVAAGTHTFDDRELEDQLTPMAVSGAADFVHIGGKLGVTSGVWEAPAVTVTEFLGDTFHAHDLIGEHDLVNVLRVSYLSRTRGYEMADLMPWEIPGALDEDGGIPAPRDYPLPFCPSATQGMRVRKIAGLRLRRQEGFSAVLPPAAVNLVGGATFTLAIPDPVFSAFDGIYEVQTIHPGLDPIGESGEVALRLPAVAIAHSEDIHDWTPAIDEEDVVNEPYDGTRTGLRPPGSLTAETGPQFNLDNGSQVIPRIRVSFDPSPSEAVTGYRWRFRADDGEWQNSGGLLDPDRRDDDDQVYFYIMAAAPPASHDIEVWAVAGTSESDKVSVTGVTFNTAVIVNSVAASSGRVTFDIDTPDLTTFGSVQIGRSGVGEGAGEIEIVGTFPLAPNEAGVEVVAGDADATNAAIGGNMADAGVLVEVETDWTVAGGEAVKVAGAAGRRIRMNTSLTGGETVRLSANVYDTTASGGVWVQIFGSATVNSDIITGDGRIATEVTAPASVTQIALAGAAAFAGKADNVQAVVSTPECLPLGMGDFWIRSMNETGTPSGSWLGPYTKFIP